MTLSDEFDVVGDLCIIDGHSFSFFDCNDDTRFLLCEMLAPI